MNSNGEAQVIQGVTEAFWQQLCAALERAGWSRRYWPTAASKMFDTAVGPRQALAELQWFGGPQDYVVLGGHYTSEGRNVLATTSVRIARDADAQAIEALVADFCAQVNAGVANSYAARLLRLGINDYPPGRLFRSGREDIGGCAAAGTCDGPAAPST